MTEDFDGILYFKFDDQRKKKKAFVSTKTLSCRLPWDTQKYSLKVQHNDRILCSFDKPGFSGEMISSASDATNSDRDAKPSDRSEREKRRKFDRSSFSLLRPTLIIQHTANGTAVLFFHVRVRAAEFPSAIEKFFEEKTRRIFAADRSTG